MAHQNFLRSLTGSSSADSAAFMDNGYAPSKIYKREAQPNKQMASEVRKDKASSAGDAGRLRKVVDIDNTLLLCFRKTWQHPARGSLYQVFRYVHSQCYSFRLFLKGVQTLRKIPLTNTERWLIKSILSDDQISRKIYDQLKETAIEVAEEWDEPKPDYQFINGIFLCMVHQRSSRSHNQARFEKAVDMSIFDSDDTIKERVYENLSKGKQPPPETWADPRTDLEAQYISGYSSEFTEMVIEAEVRENSEPDNWEDYFIATVEEKPSEIESIISQLDKVGISQRQEQKLERLAISRKKAKQRERVAYRKAKKEYKIAFNLKRDAKYTEQMFSKTMQSIISQPIDGGKINSTMDAVTDLAHKLDAVVDVVQSKTTATASSINTLVTKVQDDGFLTTLFKDTIFEGVQFSKENIADKIYLFCIDMIMYFREDEDRKQSRLIETLFRLAGYVGLPSSLLPAIMNYGTKIWALLNEVKQGVTSKFQEQSGEEHLPFVISGLTAITGVIAAFVFGIVPSWEEMQEETYDAVKHFSLKGGQIFNIFKGFKVFMESIPIVKEWITRVICFCAGKKYEDIQKAAILNSLKGDVAEWMIRVDELGTEPLKSMIPMDISLQDEAITLGDKATEYSLKLLINITDPAVISAIKATIGAAKKLSTEARAVKFQATARPDPYVMCFYGPTNIGKSTMVNSLTQDMCDFMQYPESNRMYSWNSKLKHMDGYAQQKVVIIDDFSQSTDGEEERIFFSMKTSAPFQVPMADLSEKGIQFMSNMVVATTNNPYPKPKTIYDKPALWRRRDDLIYCRALEQFVTRSSDGREIIDHQSDFSHLEFFICNPADESSDEQMVKTVPKTFTEIREYLTSRFNNHMKKQHNLLKTVRNYPPALLPKYQEQIFGWGEDETDFFSQKDAAMEQHLKVIYRVEDKDMPIHFGRECTDDHPHKDIYDKFHQWFTIAECCEIMNIHGALFNDCIDIRVVAQPNDGKYAYEMNELSVMDENELAEFYNFAMIHLLKYRNSLRRESVMSLLRSKSEDYIKRVKECIAKHMDTIILLSIPIAAISMYGAYKFFFEKEKVEPEVVLEKIELKKMGDLKKIAQILKKNDMWFTPEDLLYLYDVVPKEQYNFKTLVKEMMEANIEEAAGVQGDCSYLSSYRRDVKKYQLLKQMFEEEGYATDKTNKPKAPVYKTEGYATDKTNKPKAPVYRTEGYAVDKTNKPKAPVYKTEGPVPTPRSDKKKRLFNCESMEVVQLLSDVKEKALREKKDMALVRILVDDHNHKMIRLFTKYQDKFPEGKKKMMAFKNHYDRLLADEILTPGFMQKLSDPEKTKMIHSIITDYLFGKEVPEDLLTEFAYWALFTAELFEYPVHLLREEALDINSVELATHCVVPNMVYCAFKRHRVLPDGRTAEHFSGLQGIGVRGNSILMPKHFFRTLQAGEIIYITRNELQFQIPYYPSDLYKFKSFKINGKEVGGDKVIWFAGGHTSRMNSFKDITNNFIKEHELKHIVASKAVLYTRRNGCMTNVQIDKLNMIENLSYAESVSSFDPTIAICKGIEYAVTTMPGDCGAPLIIQNKEVSGKIAGFHILGENGDNKGITEIVTFEQLQQFKALFNEQCCSFELPDMIPDPSQDKCRNYPLGDVVYLGKAKREDTIFQSGKTDIEPSVVHGMAYPVLTAPAVLTPNDPRNESGIPPLIRNLEENVTFLPLWNHQDLELINQHDRAEEAFLKGDYQPRILSEYESINGAPDMPHLGRMNMSSSPGFPYMKYKKAGDGAGKAYLFSLDQEDNYVVSDPLLRTRLDKRLDLAKQGISMQSEWTYKLKDERRTHKKIKAGKTRTFCMGPVDHSILFGQYFGDYLNFLREHHIALANGVGIAPTGPQWGELFRHLTIHKNSGLDEEQLRNLAEEFNIPESEMERLRKIVHITAALDFVQYDKHAMAEFLKSCTEDANAYYNDSEMNKLIRRVLMEEVIFTRVRMLDVLFMTFFGLLSGFRATTDFNSKINKKYSKNAWRAIMRTRCPKFMALHFYDAFVRANYTGDDLVKVIASIVACFFNNLTIQKEMEAYGHEITSFSKEAEIHAWDDIYDITYLKRQFIPHEDSKFIIKAPLAWETITEVPQWIRHCPKPVEACVSNIMDSLLEGHQHGREKFTELLDSYNSALKRAGQKTITVSYDDYEQNFLSLFHH